MRNLLRADVKEHHSQEYQCQVEGLCLEVFLVEEGRSKEEADHHRATSNHAHNADHGTRLTQRVEIHEIGHTQEDADEDDAPMPTKRCCAFSRRIPKQQKHHTHHEKLIDVIAEEDVICRHIHLPVQHGSSRILKRMNRRYSREDYLEKVKF